MKRKKSLIISVAVIACVIIVCSVIHSCVPVPVKKTATGPDHITLTWSDDPLTTQTITWRTDMLAGSGTVKYAAANDTANLKTANDKTDTLATDIGKQLLHTALLTGLLPGRNYIYKVSNGKNWSRAYNFTTEAKDQKDFKFLVFGDSQSGDTAADYGDFKKTIHNAFRKNPDAKFFVNMGDLVEFGGKNKHWNAWFNAADSVMNYIPIMPVLGNHETYLNFNYSFSKPLNFIKQFKLPPNGPDKLKGEAYSYNYGNVHFIVLNSQVIEEKFNLTDEISWLDKDLEKTIADKSIVWKIVMFHKTPYYNKASRTNDDLKAAFVPVFDKYHVDLVLNGHDHGVSRTYPMNNDMIVNKPSKGTVYYITGHSGHKMYPDLSKKYWDAFFYGCQDHPCYIVTEVNGDKLTIKAFNQDNSLIDIYTIDKAADRDIPSSVVPETKNTRLVVFGNIAQEPLQPIIPKLINKVWYVPATAFAQFLGGYAVPAEEGKLVINLPARFTSGHNGLTLPFITDAGSKVQMVSADDLKIKFGLTYQYNAASNMLIFSKESSE